MRADSSLRRRERESLKGVLTVLGPPPFLRQQHVVAIGLENLQAPGRGHLGIEVLQVHRPALNVRPVVLVGEGDNKRRDGHGLTALTEETEEGANVGGEAACPVSEVRVVGRRAGTPGMLAAGREFVDVASSTHST